MTLTKALSLSLNTVAVRLCLEVGPKAVVRVAHRLGIASDLAPNASIALGTSEVTPLELVTAYAAFANGGIGVQPHVIARVRTANGKLLYQRRNANNGRVIDPAYVAMMNAMMQETLLTGTARKAELPGWQAAGKTGTSQDWRDAWFVGYTAYLVTGVWLGNDDGAPTKKVSGGNLPVGDLEPLHEGGASRGSGDRIAARRLAKRGPHEPRSLAGAGPRRRKPWERRSPSTKPARPRSTRRPIPGAAWRRSRRRSRVAGREKRTCSTSCSGRFDAGGASGQSDPSVRAYYVRAQECTMALPPIEIHGYAIISDDNMIAAADGLGSSHAAQPQGLGALPAEPCRLGPHRVRPAQPRGRTQRARRPQGGGFARRRRAGAKRGWLVVGPSEDALGRGHCKRAPRGRQRGGARRPGGVRPLPRNWL